MVNRGIAFGVLASLALGMPTMAQTPSPVSDAQQAADFVDYKKRLLALVGSYHSSVTTVADIEAIFGERYLPSPDQVQGGWIRKELPGYKSLTFRNRVDLYYGSVGDKTIWKGPGYFEVSYYVNFEQTQTVLMGTAPAPVYDPSTCLSLTELKAVFAARDVPLKTEDNRNEDTFLVSTPMTDILVKGHINIVAAFKPRHWTGPMDMSEGCLVSLSVM